MSINKRRRKLRAPGPRRTYVDQAGHIDALLSAAAEIDREARTDQSTPRYAILATLTLAGLRIGELLALRWEDVDLAAGRLRVIASKTDAGVREVAVLPVLREELSTLKAPGLLAVDRVAA
jgi:integrase